MLEILLERIKKTVPGTILFIGDTDTGKTTLCHSLARALLKEGLEVALVDTDIGQSSLFLPATTSAKVIKKPEDLISRRPDYIYFVGLWNPALGPDRHIEASVRSWRFVQSRAPVKLIDTTGLVRDIYGLRLKIEKFRRINPDLVVALQRHNELEHILRELPPDRVLVIEPSPEVRVRSRAERIRYRNSLYRAYFQEVFMHEVPQSKVRYLYRFFKTSQTGLLCGLLSQGRIAGLGIVDDYSAERFIVLSPLDKTEIEACLVGAVHIEEEIYY